MKKIFALLTALVLLLNITACGNSISSSAPAPSGSSSDSTATTPGQTIKVGWLAPLTGTAAENGQQVTWAAEMIVDLVNNSNADIDMLLAADAGLPNLNGAKIQLVKADTKGDTTVATSEAKRLISEEGCVALTGQLTSGMSKAIAVITEQYGVPLVTAGSAVSLTDDSSDYEWLIRYNLTDYTYIEDSYKLMDEMKAKGNDLKTVALLSEDSEFGANIFPVEASYANIYGYEVVENMTYAANSTSLTSEVLKLKKANPDVLMVAGYATDVILLINTMKDADWFPKMLIGQRGGFATADFFSALGDKTEYCFTTGGWSADLTGKAVIKSLYDLYPTYSKGISFNEGMSKDAVDILLICAAINQAGTTEPEALRTAMLNLNIDLNKIWMPWNSISMDKHGQNTSATGVIMQVQNGAYVTVYPVNVATADAIVPAVNWLAR
ncbi:MAG TPA: ABC transporter substrate-binding protein [Clostridia bacterium]|nr:ABC transporter substrate-binding protein [Clostridia bacterium]